MPRQPNAKPAASAPAARKTAAKPVPAVPTGSKITGNLGPGVLNPGIGKRVQRSGQPEYCGAIVGMVAGYVTHPNARDATRTSIRFAGDFRCVRVDGTVLTGRECYLPSGIQRAMKAACDLQQGRMIPLSVEVWCEPDEEGRPASPVGYSYVTYDRRPQDARDPLLALAYESGILERPEAEPQQLAAPEETYDPETGEVETVQH